MDLDTARQPPGKIEESQNFGLENIESVAAFVLQVNEDGVMTPDVATAYECIDAHGWFTGRRYITIFSSDGLRGAFAPSQLSQNSFPLDDYEPLCVGVRPQIPFVPVGSVEFCEGFLQKYHGFDRISSINIPQKLRHDVRVGRLAAYDVAPDEVKSFFDAWGVEELFVKRSDRCKAWEPRIIRRGSLCSLPPDGLYLVSSVQRFVSEWRCFVFRSVLRDIRCYAGDQFVLPAKKGVERMISDWKPSPLAYTLDVGVTEEGRTVLIEAHNFVACGLYGFDDFGVLPQMLVAGYIHETSHPHKASRKTG